MWDVKPGDLIVCVDAAPRPFPVSDMSGLGRSEVYTVRDTGHDPFHQAAAVWLVEIIRPKWDGIESGFDINRFRPVSKVRSEEFHRLVAPVGPLQTVDA